MIPIENRVVILPEPEEEINGFKVPETAKSKPIRGKIIVAGAGKPNGVGGLEPMTCKEGDIVIYNKFGGTDVKIDGVDYVIMRESDVLTVL